MNTSAFVETLQGKKINIEFESPMPYHIDGEAMEPAARFSVEMRAGSLRVIVPKDGRLRP
ncbi:MAG: hypothetical protein WDN75_19550 [Bacteroidota bacterium]